MENKEQTSLEIENENIRNTERYGDSNEVDYDSIFQHEKNVLADQKTKILNILKNWFIRGNHYYTQRTITTIIMRIEDLDKKKFEEL